MKRIVFTVILVAVCAPPASFARARDTGDREAAANSTSRQEKRPCPEIIYIDGKQTRTAHWYICRGLLPRTPANRQCYCPRSSKHRKYRRGRG